MPPAPPIRIGVVRYLNTLPLIVGLEKHRGLTLHPAAPAALAGMLAAGEVDIALISIIDALRPPAGGPPLALLPVGAIGCAGPTLTVGLFSRVPFAEVTRLHADRESHSSVVLAQVLLGMRHGRRPEIVPLDAGDLASTLVEAEAVLLIGDKVVADAPPLDDFTHRLDLGQAWREATGLPFVYACWACRAAEAGETRIAEAAALLDRQRRRNALRLGQLAAEGAGRHRWPAPLAQRYLCELLCYEVGEQQRRAVARFAREAAALGLCDGTDPPWVREECCIGAGA